MKTNTAQRAALAHAAELDAADVLRNVAASARLSEAALRAYNLSAPRESDRALAAELIGLTVTLRAKALAAARARRPAISAGKGAR